MTDDGTTQRIEEESDAEERPSLGARIVAGKGVVISKLEPKSYLARIGARPGDVIRKVDDITIENKADFDKTIIKYRLKPSLVLLLQRGEQGYYITVQL